MKANSSFEDVPLATLLSQVKWEYASEANPEI